MLLRSWQATEPRSIDIYSRRCESRRRHDARGLLLRRPLRERDHRWAQVAPIRFDRESRAALRSAPAASELLLPAAHRDMSVISPSVRVAEAFACR
ncbi:PH domain-containing protein [Pseudonocardia oroxyli]|uniref:PH domain-containing protein n=1 Tax=Pseudonocardia oroxyli TaxID=366584 RepID=UPI0015A112B5